MKIKHILSRFKRYFNVSNFKPLSEGRESSRAKKSKGKKKKRKGRKSERQGRQRPSPNTHNSLDQWILHLLMYYRLNRHFIAKVSFSPASGSRILEDAIQQDFEQSFFTRSHRTVNLTAEKLTYKNTLCIYRNRIYLANCIPCMRIFNIVDGCKIDRTGWKLRIHVCELSVSQKKKKRKK